MSDPHATTQAEGIGELPDPFEPIKGPSVTLSDGTVLQKLALRDQGLTTARLTIHPSEEPLSPETARELAVQLTRFATMKGRGWPQ